jgi:hypothetical protein
MPPTLGVTCPTFRFGQDTVEHAKAVGRGIRDAAERGNYVGAATGAVGGAIALSLGTAFRAVGAAMSLPGTAVGAVTQKPRTPKERAAVYAAAANEKWLSMRVLRAELMDTPELARNVGLPMTRLLGRVHASADRSAAGQINALNEFVCELVETNAESTLDLEESTLWLIIFQEGSAAPATEVKGDGNR